MNPTELHLQTPTNTEYILVQPTRIADAPFPPSPHPQPLEFIEKE